MVILSVILHYVAISGRGGDGGDGGGGDNINLNFFIDFCDYFIF